MAYANDPAGTMRANLFGTMNLLDYARDAGARLIFLSSGEVYGLAPAPEGGFREEDIGGARDHGPPGVLPGEQARRGDDGRKLV